MELDAGESWSMFLFLSSCTSSQNLSTSQNTFYQLQLLRSSWTPQVGADVERENCKRMEQYSGLLFQFTFEFRSTSLMLEITASPTYILQSPHITPCADPDREIEYSYIHSALDWPLTVLDAYMDAY